MVVNGLATLLHDVETLRLAVAGKFVLHAAVIVDFRRVYRRVVGHGRLLPVFLGLLAAGRVPRGVKFLVERPAGVAIAGLLTGGAEPVEARVLESVRLLGARRVLRRHFRPRERLRRLVRDPRIAEPLVVVSRVFRRLLVVAQRITRRRVVITLHVRLLSYRLSRGRQIRSSDRRVGEHSVHCVGRLVAEPRAMLVLLLALVHLGLDLPSDLVESRLRAEPLFLGDLLDDRYVPVIYLAGLAVAVKADLRRRAVARRYPRRLRDLVLLQRARRLVGLRQGVVRLARRQLDDVNVTVPVTVTPAVGLVNPRLRHRRDVSRRLGAGEPLLVMTVRYAQRHETQTIQNRRVAVSHRLETRAVRLVAARQRHGRPQERQQHAQPETATRKRDY